MMDLLSSYSFDLPEELIAQQPIQPRDASRLLVVHRKEGKWEHRNFKDLPEYLDSNDFMIANNTRVLKARLLGHRLIEKNGVEVQGGEIEFVLLEEIQPHVWEGLFHASARYVAGLRFEVPLAAGGALQGVLLRGVADSRVGTVVAEFDQDPIESGAGVLPLPHYIDRTEQVGADGCDDEVSYQTIYAKKIGSAAAPTAGLHLSEAVMNELQKKGVSWGEVTLNIGLGTFRPVKEADISKHVMHEERYEISSDVAERVCQWKSLQRRVLAVGTTSARTLESASQIDKQGKLRIASGSARTSLFIRPGAYSFRVVDRLLTNFHLPRSTLLMLVCTLAGKDLTLAAYQDAIKKRYRFFSYGDAMLVL